jgi:hypothetical protein
VQMDGDPIWKRENSGKERVPMVEHLG